MNNDSQLLDVMSTFDTAMLVTQMNGTPNGRPMSIAGQDDDGTLWFITSADSPKAEEVKENAEALVTMQSRSAHALVRGTAALVDDASRLEKLWSRGAELYFPDGPQTEEATLLRFTPTEGEYWDLRGKKGLTFAAEAAKALWSGRKVADVASSHGQERL